MEKKLVTNKTVAQDDHAIAESATLANPSRARRQSKRTWFKPWPFFLAHLVCCIALSLVLALAVNGYNAIDTSTPHYADGTFRLRVSDVTTLVSMGLIITKFFVTCWSSFAIWRCGYILTHNTDSGLTLQQLSFMTKYKMPPWIRYPFQQPRGPRSWAVTAILLFLVPQSFIAPLLTGAVDWNPSTVPGGTTVAVNSTVFTAHLAPDWQQYVLSSYATVRKIVFKQATGFANLAWADSSLVLANGTSNTGNGCRHVVNNNGLPVGSTLRNSVVPCISIRDISWATSADEVPRTVSNGIKEPQSLVNETLQQYLVIGQSVLFDPDKPWNDTRDSSDLPEATVFSGQLKLGLLIARESTNQSCKGLHSNSFGEVGKLPYYMFNFGEDTCYLTGTVTLTAGVTNSAVSTYIAPNVVEDQTPIDKVNFDPSPWVQDSLWLLPDLMTDVSVSNSTLLATWDNLDAYAKRLISQSYLGAWDSLHAAFDQSSQISNATPQEPRIKATVSFSRVFAWLGISSLMTIGGILLLISSFEKEEADLPDSEIALQDKEAKKDARAIMKDLKDLSFF